MSLESANYISELDASNPDGLTDYVSQGDDHLRLIKTALVQSFPNIDSAVTFTSAQLNTLNANLTHSGTTFNAQANAITNVTALDSNSAVEPRSYNDSRYVRPLVSSNDIQLLNTKAIVVENNTAGLRDAIAMDASDILQIGDAVNPGVVNVNGTAFKYNGADVFNAIFPIGSIYENGTVSTNPATLMGFGTWTAFGSGRVTVAYDVGVTEFNALGKTGGTTTHTLTESEMPAHTHTVGKFRVGGSTSNVGGFTTGTTHVSGSTGGGTAHQNCQPYITVYRWIRTA